MKNLKYFVLEVYNKKMQEWQTLDCSTLQYSEKETEEREYNFIDFCKQVEDVNATRHWEHSYFNVEYSLFKKEPRLYTIMVFNCTIFKSKDYETIKFRTRALERKNLSMETLIKELPNEELLEYLRDKNIQALSIK